MGEVMFKPERAVDILDICSVVEVQGKPDVTFSPGSQQPCVIDGSLLRQSSTKAFTFRNGNSDTEGLTSISAAGDIVVAFRGSELGLIPANGALRDWLLTDFRSNRMPYSLKPGT